MSELLRTGHLTAFRLTASLFSVATSLHLQVYQGSGCPVLMWDSNAHRLPSLRDDSKPWDGDDGAVDAPARPLSSQQLTRAFSQLLQGKTALTESSASRFVVGQRGVVDVAFTYSGKLSPRCTASSPGDQASLVLDVIADQTAGMPAALRGGSTPAPQLEVISALPQDDDDGDAGTAVAQRRPNARDDDDVYLPVKLLEGMLVRPGPDWHHGAPSALGDGVVIKPFRDQMPGRVHVRWCNDTTGVYRYDETWRDLYAVREQDVPSAKLQRRIRVLKEQLKTEQFRASKLKGSGAEEGIRKRLVSAGRPKEEVEPVSLTTLHECFAHVGLSLSDKEVNEVAERLARRALPVALAQHLTALRKRDDVMVSHGPAIDAARLLMEKHGAKLSTAYELARNDSVMAALAKVRDQLETAGAYEEKQQELRMICDMVYVLEALVSHVRTTKDPTALAQLGERGSRIGVTLATFLVRRAQGAAFPLRGLPEMQLDGRGRKPVVSTKPSSTAGGAGNAGSTTTAGAAGEKALLDYTVAFNALEYKRAYGAKQLGAARDQLEVTLPTCALLHHLGAFHVGFPKPHGRVTYELLGTVHFDVWRSSAELLKDSTTDKALALPWPERARDAATASNLASESRSRSGVVDLFDPSDEAWWSIHEGVTVRLRITPEDDWSAEQRAEAEAFAAKSESRETLRAQRQAAAAAARASRPRSSRGDGGSSRRSPSKSGRLGSSSYGGSSRSTSTPTVSAAFPALPSSRGGGGAGRRSGKFGSGGPRRTSERESRYR